MYICGMETLLTPSYFKQLYQYDTVYNPVVKDNFLVWILVSYPQEDVMPETTWAFLQKVLGAMHLNLRDVKVSNIASESWKDYRQDSPIPYQQVWAFGEILPTVFPALPALPLYEPHTAEDIAYLRSDSLEVLQQDTNRKKQLWSALQGLMK